MVRSRLAQILFLVHLVVVAYTVHRMPVANPVSWDSGGGCHGVPIADRVLFYCDATGLLRVVATLDFIAIALFAFLTTMLLFVGILLWWLPDVGFHVFSWGVAVVLLIVTSFQWMLIGATSNDCCGALPEMAVYNLTATSNNSLDRSGGAKSKDGG